MFFYASTNYHKRFSAVSGGMKFENWQEIGYSFEDPILLMHSENFQD